jgi:hypothetical protein
MRTEYLYNPQMDTTTVYLWKGTVLVDKDIYPGELSSKEKKLISTKLLKKHSA